MRTPWQLNYLNFFVPCILWEVLQDIWDCSDQLSSGKKNTKQRRAAFVEEEELHDFGDVRPTGHVLRDAPWIYISVTVFFQCFH